MTTWLAPRTNEDHVTGLKATKWNQLRLFVCVCLFSGLYLKCQKNTELKGALRLTAATKLL